MFYVYDLEIVQIFGLFTMSHDGASDLIRLCEHSKIHHVA